MKYKIGKTKIIHLPSNFENIVLKKEIIIQILLTAEIYKTQKGVLPIIIEGKIRLLENKEIIFSCIFHTRVILIFQMDENPINDLIDLFDKVHMQEVSLWDSNLKNSSVHKIDLNKIKLNTEVKFNKACEIIEAARSQNLLT